MEILLVTENWEPDIGGIEKYLVGMTKSLIKAENEVEVIAPKKSSKKKVLSVKNMPNVIRRRFYWPVVKPAWKPLYKWIYRRAKKQKWDITLCGKGLFEGLVGLRLKSKLGIPYVIFTYAMEIEEWKKKWWTRIKLKRVLKGADRIVCINEVTRKSLTELVGEEEKIIKIWPGVEDEMFKEAGRNEIDRVLKKYEVGQPYVLSVGRLIERKGFDTLIEAFCMLDQTKFQDMQLIIVGDGPLLEKLDDIGEKNFMGESIIFLPDVPDEEMPALYAGAELFALTPREINGDFEGFGIVYLEAAAQGVPAVGTKTGGVTEAIIDGETGIVVEKENEGRIKNAMEKLLSDNQLREKLGSGALTRALNLKWEQQGKLFNDVLREVTANKQ